MFMSSMSIYKKSKRWGNNDKIAYRLPVKLVCLSFFPPSPHYLIDVQTGKEHKLLQK